MSYQVLARKWRPKSFATLVGQEHVVRALTHALEQQRLHHAYLFTGTRGVGKTTLARIMAKALNCEAGVSAQPCGVCSSCVEIDGGRFIDYIELDAASNRGVDDMTQLLERATYAPTRGRYKVYVIDEVHQLSGHAFNAMLKTLEEPPEHVKFILATTDPQKIPVTVLSRCLQFNLKQMPPHHIVEHLGNVLTQEGLSFEPGALRHLAKAAAGSMRDALSLLDAIVGADAAQLVGVADQMMGRSLSFDSALQELGSLLHRIALVQMAPQAMLDGAERERLQPYADALDAEFLQLCYQIVIHGRDDMPLAPDEYAGFTMTLLRLAAFRPETPRGEAGPRRGAPLQMPSARKSVALTPPAHKAVPVQAPAAAAPALSAAGAASGDVHDWHAIAGQLTLTGMARQLAQHCELVGLSETNVELNLSSAHRHLAGKAAQDKLQAELSRYFAKPLRLTLAMVESAGETPSERNQQEQRQRQERAIAAIEEDSVVRDIVDTFDATINEASIKPLQGNQE